MAEGVGLNRSGPSLHFFDCKDVQNGRALELHLVEKTEGFCNFVETASKETLVRVFKEAIEFIEVKRRILDYHMKVRDLGQNNSRSFCIQVFYGEERDGPENPDACISCSAEAPLFPNSSDSVLAGECTLENLSERPFVLCSIDGQARAGFIITPVRHVERLSELEDDELYWLWKTAVRALTEEGVSQFKSMIANHGKYRHLPHLHLKVWIDDLEQERIMMRWNDSKKQVWSRLQGLAASLPKKRKACVMFQNKGWCRYQDRCRFAH